MPGSMKSSVKRPLPVTWRGPSLLRARLPTNLAIFESCGCVLDGVDDLHVARAHAKIAGQRFANLFLAGIRLIAQQRVARHHHSRGAVTTLKRVVFNESFLNGA